MISYKKRRNAKKIMAYIDISHPEETTNVSNYILRKNTFNENNKTTKEYYFSLIIVDSNPEEAKSVFPIFSNYFLKITHSQKITKN
jgi:hypothetical protein